MSGPTTTFSKSLHARKYRGAGESFREAMNRIAATTKDNDAHWRATRDILLDMRFLPGGRIQSAVGSTRAITAFNCLGGDTPTLTRNGVIPLKDLVGTTPTILDGNSSWFTAPVYSHGFQETHEVTLTRGRLKQIVTATANHDWVLTDGTVLSTQELKKNMRVPHKTAPKYKAPGEYEVGLCHGFIYGDGTKTKDGGYCVRVCKGKEYAHNFLSQFPYSVPPTNNGDRLYYLFGDNALVDWKELPYDRHPGYILGFMRGLFLADGCITTQSEVMITGPIELYEWVNQFGPVAGWYPTGKSILSPRTNFCIRNRDTFNIRFDLWSLIPEDLLRGSDRLTHQQNIGWRVSKIKAKGVEEVFCPSVSSTRSFTLGNGLHTRQCYVSGNIDDSFVEGPASIMQRATEAATTMRMGGGIGYDFSSLRPRGSLIRKLQSQSSGPVSFMEIFDAVCRCTASSGHRRGAQMGIMRIDHPDIEEFIHAKQNSDRLTGFNVSVAVTNAFMQALEADAEFDLLWEGKVHKTISASALWETIMRSTWDWAEPGVIFIDTINEANNLWYCETILATNPCSEQPLPPHGACLLGSFNLVKYLTEELGKFSLDLDQLVADMKPIVRAMDNVIDVARYPLRLQELEAKRKRRMGLGITGLANALEACGYPYGSKEFLIQQEIIQQLITRFAYRASAELSDEKGCFPEYKSDLYGSKGFVSTLDSETLSYISDVGIRNSHLTSIAPTGTISLCADNVSSGIEPVFAHKSERTVIDFDGPTTTEVWDYGLSELQVHGKTSEEVTIDEHLNVLLTAQRNVDSAVSKTLNVPESTSWEDFKNIYLRAYEGGAKGCTTYKVGGKREAVMKKVEDASCKIDPKTGVRSCDD